MGGRCTFLMSVHAMLADELRVVEWFVWRYFPTFAFIEPLTKFLPLWKQEAEVRACVGV